jgi:hypothetical protein
MRVSARFDAFTKTAMLDAGVAMGVDGALTESNSKSSNATPIGALSTSSA